MKLTDYIASLSPYLAPIPTAYIISRRLTEIGWDAPVAILTGVVIETLGISASDTLLTLYQYNQSKRKIDPRAPLSLSVAVLGFYLLIALVLTVLLEIIPLVGERISSAAFPFLSLTGVMVLALRANHAQRLRDIAAARAQAKEARRSHTEPKPQPVEVMRYVCVICGRGYEKQQSLAAHMRSHERKNGHKKERVIYEQVLP